MWSSTCWSSVPPRATFSTWMPRHTASVGRSRATTAPAVPTAGADVHPLEAAAPRGRGRVAGDDGPRDREVGRVASWIHGAALWMGVVAVGRGVDVAPAGDHHGVDRVEQAVDVVRIGDGKDHR